VSAHVTDRSSALPTVLAEVARQQPPAHVIVVADGMADDQAHLFVAVKFVPAVCACALQQARASASIGANVEGVFIYIYASCLSTSP
jgi:hypothetical protein